MAADPAAGSPSWPAPPEGTQWGLHVIDLADGSVLASRDADLVVRTASIGKIFLLIEVARRLEAGELDPDELCEAAPEHYVEDSGLLYAMRRRAIPVQDAAVLVGAVSDNLATNALLDRCGLESVRAVAPGLGLTSTTLLDYIRDERTPGMPWTPSYGTARELASTLAMLDSGSVVGAAVAERVLGWLALGTDTSMVASALRVDPLAHTEPDPRGLTLAHKTGTTSFARADVGIVRGPRGALAYAALANWPEGGPSLHVPVLDAMARVGEVVVDLVTGDRP